MKTRFETFLGKLSESTEKLRSMPLITAKYYIIKEVYNFLVFANEFKTNSFASYSSDETALAAVVPALDVYLEKMKNFISAVNACKSVDEISSVLQDFIDVTLVQFLGWLTMNRGAIPSSCLYNDYYKIRPLCSDDELFDGTDYSCLNALMAKAFASISTRRQYLNVFCRESHNISERYSTSGENCFWRYLLRTDTAFVSAGNPYDAKLYMYCQTQESNSDAIEYGTSNFEKVICGDSGSVKISSMFDIGFTAFRAISSFLSQSDTELRLFKASCNALFSHVRRGGIAMILLPEVFLYNSVLYFLCTRLENISFVRDDSAPGMVIVTGVLRSRSVLTLDDTCTAMCENMLHDEGYEYELTGQAPETIVFRSAVPTAAEIMESVETNKNFLLKNIRPVYNKLRLDPSEKAVRPAMMFSPGQLGLILTSGRIDGVVDEGNGHYHVIKGSVIKNPVTTESFEEDGTRIVSTVTGNATSVTMLTADGEFKTLT